MFVKLVYNEETSREDKVQRRRIQLVFNSDYRLMHNREQHGGRIVPFETHDAVKDSFEASKRRKEFLRKGIEEEPVCSSTMTDLTAIQQSVIVVVNEIILIHELLNLLGKIRSRPLPITISRGALIQRCQLSRKSVSLKDFSDFP